MIGAPKMLYSDLLQEVLIFLQGKLILTPLLCEIELSHMGKNNGYPDL